jgi:dTDP-4-amino-4,6-dideoxygalactose transaminase
LIPHSRPFLGDTERAAVVAVIESGHLSGGWEVSARLEARLATMSERDGGVVVSSGSTALELALRAVGATGTRVVVPAYACLSIERAVRRAGAIPELIDVDESDLGLPLGWSSVAPAAVVVHQFGIPSGALAEVASVDLAVEDFTTVLGGEVGGHAPGSLGNLAVVSLAATKMVCAGEGGAVVGGNAAIAELRRWTDPESDVDVDLPVPNAKMGELAAAVALAQLDRLDDFLARRRAIAEYYQVTASSLGLDVKRAREGDRGTWWRFLVGLPASVCVDEVVAAARREGVAIARPVPSRHWAGRGHFPAADRLHASLISIPIYPGLVDTEVERVVDVWRNVLPRTRHAPGHLPTAVAHHD